VYADVDAALADAANSCRACGKCCRFQPGGIVLFASALELAYLVFESGPAPGGMPTPPLRGHVLCVGNSMPSEQRAGHATQSYDAPWRCPYQAGDRCVARRGRTLGCRTYFCEDAARAEGERIHAGAFARVKAIAGPDGWWYGPARVYLDR
jgi:Fe-S-cluster containining protein